jgi:hypothetical protein
MLNPQRCLCPGGCSNTLSAWTPLPVCPRCAYRCLTRLEFKPAHAPSVDVVDVVEGQYPVTLQ